MDTGDIAYRKTLGVSDVLPSIYARGRRRMVRLMNGRMRILVLGATLGGLVGAASMRSLSAQQGRRPASSQGYITGVVRSDSVPQAGVWVIAETKDLPTPFTKIVVTDDRGRFMLPELPEATYSVWVRGYGLEIGRAHV